MFHQLLAGPYSLKELAKISGGTLSYNSNGEAQFSDVAPLKDACTSDVSFLDNNKYTDCFSVSSAGAAIIRPTAVSKAPAGMQLIVMDNPYQGYARVARAFYPEKIIEKRLFKTATVDKTALIGNNCRIDHGSY